MFVLIVCDVCGVVCFNVYVTIPTCQTVCAVWLGGGSLSRFCGVSLVNVRVCGDERLWW